MNKAIIIIVVLIVVLGGYFFLKNNYKSPTPGTNQNTSLNANQDQTTTVANGSKVTIKNFAFDPPVLNIKAGDTVTWINEDSAPHKIKSDTFNSENLSTGSSFLFKFDNKGIYDYFCSMHPSMKGKIIVE